MNKQTIPSVSLMRQILVLAVAYAAMGWLVRLIGWGTSSVFAAAVWPSSGIALGALLVCGRRLWPGVWLGTFFVTLTQTLHGFPLGDAVTASAVIAVGATLQALIGHALARRTVGTEPALDTEDTVLRFFVLCGALASVVSATFGVVVLAALGGMKVADAPIGWLTWWIGDAIGVVLGTPLVMVLYGRPSSIWRPRRLTVGLPLVVAIVIFTAVFAAVGKLEHGNLQAEFDNHAALLANAVDTSLNAATEAANSISDLLRAEHRMDSEEFKGFASGVHQRHPAIQALEWIPRIPRAMLAEHERATRAEGFADYAVREKTKDGKRVAVGVRDEYFPVNFVYPMDGNLLALGFDLGSEEMRRTALMTARRTKQLTTSGRIRLVQEKGSQYGVLIFAPNFVDTPQASDDGLIGYGLTVLRVGQLMEGALQGLPHEHLAYRLEDLDAKADEQLLYAKDAAAPFGIASYSQDFTFGNRHWRYTVATGDHYKFTHRGWYIWATLTGGSMLVTILSAFLLLMSARTLRTEQLVTERTVELEDARAEAERQEQLLHEAVASLSQGFTIYDSQDRLVVCNEAYRRFHGAKADLIVPGKTFEEMVRSGALGGNFREAAGTFEQWVASRIARHQSANGEMYERQIDDGRWLLVVEQRTPSGYIVGNRVDITDIKRTAAALEERNIQLDTIFRMSPDGLVIFDRQGTIKFANPAFLQATGLTAGDIIGISFVDLESLLRQRAENPLQWAGLRSYFSLQDGLEERAVPNDAAAKSILFLRPPHAVVLEFIGLTSDSASIGQLLYVRDVTQQVEVDRIKSEFLSHAAHELRTPMASIYGFSELLISQDFDEATRKDLLLTIHKQTAWLVDIINELLDLVRIESRRGKDFKIEAVALAPLIEEVAETLQIDAAHWPLTLRLPDELPPVSGDVAKLRQTFTNLLGNAVKYSPAGGAIEVLGTYQAGEQPMVSITITDHGIGMTPAQIARVCERFYRADTSGAIPGTGLGMSIVKEIVELLGGRLEIKSKFGAGTSVTLWLKIHDPSVPTPAPSWFGDLQ